MGPGEQKHGLWGQEATNSQENNEQLIEAENWSLESEALCYVVVKSLANVAFSNLKG